MALKKDQITRPVLRKEAVPVPELGGEVVVRALLLSERFALFDGMADGGAKYVQMARVLSMAVVDADGQALMPEREWDVFGAEHYEAMGKLFDVAKRLSGLDAEAVRKN
jgi:hypothetical protein